MSKRLRAHVRGIAFRRARGRRGLLVLGVAAAIGAAAIANAVVGSGPSAPAAPRASASPLAATPGISVTRSAHDRSASLRGLAPTADPCNWDRAGRRPVELRPCAVAADPDAGSMSAASEAHASSQSALAVAPDGGAAEQTSFGPRAALSPVASFNTGLNGGALDNNLGVGPTSVVAMINSRFEVTTKTGTVTFGPVNNNTIFAGTNEVQPVALTGYAANGNSYTLSYNGDTSVPITRGQNNTAAGIQAAIQGGNEQQQLTLAGFAGTGSYQLNYNGVDSVPFVRGTNHTAAAIAGALNGTGEVQSVSLDSYDTAGDSYTLSYNGAQTVPIVRGQNDTAAGIANALQGGNEVQAITFSNFNAAQAGNTFRLKVGDRLSSTMGFATALGDAVPVTSQNVSDEINSIFGFKGTVTVAGASNTAGPTITFAGASAGTDVPPVEIVFGACASAPTPCTYTNRESAKGGPPLAGWPVNGTAATVAVGTVTDAGYTLTFGGGGLQGSDVSPVSVTNGSGTSGTVAETTKGAPGLLPVGSVAAVGTVADTGYTVTFGGSLTKTDAAPLTVTSPSAGVTGTVRENAKGSPGFAGWLSDTTVTIGTVADTGYTVTFNALTPLNSARQTGLGDVSQLQVTNGTSGAAGTVTTTTQGKPGIGQGACTNSGDGHIQYDQLAQRWLFTVPSFTRTGGLYAMCYAVTTGTDPLGPYNRYVFRRSLFPDYPRVAVWPDGYYNATSTGDNVIEKHACAVNRARMLQGLDATEMCIIVPAVSFMEPANVDGYTPPPAGAPEYFFAAGGYQLRSIFEDNGIYAYKFHADWDNPFNSTFTGPQKIAVSPYHFLCDGQLTNCVPQPGTTTRLDAQGDKIMHRVAYRNLGDHESIVLQHSINTQVGGGGPRWYELRLDGNRDPVLFQQSTYAPDNRYRWMGSIGMDRKGGIGIGFSYGGGPYTLPITTTSCVQPACTVPGVRFTARQAGDALGTMSYADGVIMTGTGVQSSGGNRWEDWAVLAIDPTDDCTFWFNGGYMPSGQTNYNGRIGAWRLPNCRLDATGAAPPPAKIRQFNGTVATFTDSDLTATDATFTAVIDWGDGTTSPATVTGGNGSFTVAGSHTFTVTGPSTVTTSITGTEGSTATASFVLQVDATGPVTTATFAPPTPNGSNGWYVTQPSVTLSATDESGVASTSYSLDGGPVTPYTAPVAATGDGSHTLQFSSVDSLGNQEATKSVTWKVDTVAPATTASLVHPPDGDHGWYVTQPSVTLSATDATSGPAGSKYSLDGGPWTDYTGPVSATTEGGHVLRYYSVDAAGNQEAERSIDWAVDLAPPTTTATLTPGIQNGWYASPSLKLTVADGPGSGNITDPCPPHVLCGFTSQFSRDGGPWTAYTAPLTGFSTGNHFVQFRSTDFAGRVEAVKLIAFKVDAVPPSVNITTPAEGALIPLDKIVTAKFKCSPEPATQSGIASCVGTVADGAKIDTATVGDHTFTVTGTDRAGNVTVVTHHYHVVYTWNGFFKPIANTDANDLNLVHAGDLIKLGFGLNGNRGLNVLAYPPPDRSTLIECPAGGALHSVPAGGLGTTPGLSYGVASGHYTYGWQTSAGWAGTCRRFQLELSDGSGVVHTADFMFFA